MEPNHFDIEYHSESNDITDDLKAKVEKRLEKLMRGHKDITGASIAVQKTTGDTTAHTFKARVVFYHRPDNIAAVEKGESAALALGGALEAAERQVREQRKRLRERSRRR